MFRASLRLLRAAEDASAASKTASKVIFFFFFFFFFFFSNSKKNLLHSLKRKVPSKAKRSMEDRQILMRKKNRKIKKKQHTHNKKKKKKKKYSKATSFRNTIVNLNRTPEDLAREAALVDAYSRGMNAMHLAMQKRNRDMFAAKDNALCELPMHFRVAALVPDTAPVPDEMNPPTHTPPIPDYDTQASYGRPDRT
jgi:hypothetical protein